MVKLKERWSHVRFGRIGYWIFQSSGGTTLAAISDSANTSHLGHFSFESTTTT